MAGHVNLLGPKISRGTTLVLATAHTCSWQPLPRSSRRERAMEELLFIATTPRRSRRGCSHRFRRLLVADRQAGAHHHPRCHVRRRTCRRGRRAKAAWPKTKAELPSLADCDPYRLLELDDFRWRASADDIKKAYRRMVSSTIPTSRWAIEAAEERVAKKQAEGDDDDDEDEKTADAAEDEADEMFKAITEAFERTLGPKRRRDFDSLDDFDESIPPKDFDAATHGDFFDDVWPRL